MFEWESYPNSAGLDRLRAPALRRVPGDEKIGFANRSVVV